jgi:peptide/nickel transport system permease protein
MSVDTSGLALVPAPDGPRAETSLDSKSRVRRETIRQLVRSPTFLIGLAIVVFWVFCAFFSDAIIPHDPINDSLGAGTSAAPSSSYWFGLDEQGRDVFSRVIAGSANILKVAPLATAIGIGLGTLLGLVMGYFRGWTDNVIGRIIDAVLAIPLIVFAILILTALSGQSEGITVTPVRLAIVIGLAFTPPVARTVRAAALAERDLDYVQAAKLRGEFAPYIMLAEILPNVVPTIIVEATVRLGYAIFTAATLAFLSYGVQPPTPDWGLDIAEQYQNVSFAWWESIFPALAIASLIVAVNLVADAVQQVLEG